MSVSMSPVPSDERDLVRSACCRGLNMTEAFHSRERAFRPHAHESATVTLVLAGSFEETYSGRVRSRGFDGSNALVRPAGEPHSNRFGVDGVNSIVIEFSADRVSEIDAFTPILGGLRGFQHPAIPVLASRLHHEIAAEDPVSPLAREATVLELMACLSRISTPRREPAPDLQSPLWLRHAVDRLCGNPNDIPPVSELAAEAGVHPVHFARMFRRFYKENPGSFLRRQKLEWARREIERHRLPLVEISALAGFYDQSHFTRVFKQRYGISPGKYRSLALPARQNSDPAP